MGRLEGDKKVWECLAEPATMGSHYHGRQEGQGEEASLEPEDGSCAQETGLTGQI